MRRTTKTRAVAVATSAVLALGLSPALTATAAPGAGGDAGGGGTGDDTTGSLYADLIKILRDVHGVPILKTFDVVGEDGTTTELCVQPVSDVLLPGMTEADAVVNPADGRTVYLVPLLGETLVDGVVDPAAEEEEEEEVEACDPDPAYAMYVSEAELERLNMARQPAENMDRHLAEVTAALEVAESVTLDGAGRITIDGIPVDAAPKHSAIFRSLVESGTIPGLDAVPAAVGELDAWELAAAAVGTATGKSVPITIDAIAYYNRIVQVPSLYEPSDTWQMSFFETDPTTGEQFVDYSAFTYDREAMYTGCATWLDVPTLTWQVSPVLEAVDFLDLPPIAAEDGTLTDIAAFAQMADDVRSVINYLHENEVVAGFFLDPVFENSCDEQAAALVNPATTWGPVPDDLIQTVTTSTTASAYMPWDGTALASAALRITVAATDTGAALTAADQVELLLGPAAEPVTFTVQDGALVGQWAPAEGLALAPGDRFTADATLTVGASAPVGAYALTLELVDLATGEPVATDVALTQVHDDTPTVLWADIDGYAAQATFIPATARVVNPVTQPALEGADIRITVDALEDFTATTQVAAWSEAVPATFTLVEGNLVALWPLPTLEPGYDALLTWYLNVAAGAPLGDYLITLDLLADDGTVLSTDQVGTQIIEATEHKPDTGGGGGGGDGDGDGDGDVVFVDVTEGNLFYDEIMWLADTGLSTGWVTEDGTYFRPTSPLSREAMAAFIYRYSETTWTPTDGRQTFSDVPPGHPFYTEIEWMAEEGLADGYADGSYGAVLPVSRQAMAAFLNRLAGATDYVPSGTPAFSDVGVEHPFYVEIEWMEEVGLANGYDDGTFRGAETLSRQASAAFLYRFDSLSD